MSFLTTQVDPGAIGLTTTSDGKPKVIDIIDCSGSGDVAMGALVLPVSTAKDGRTISTLQGLSGRTLTLNSTWNNPSGQYRLGIKVILFICFVCDSKVASQRNAVDDDFKQSQ